ncbi:hypothetical protein [Pyrobaculum sp.]|uniref:hypothetical protein n=1 Tax=Pyrobaculum sp. TaxID=2004705 RepID=UPI003D12C31D
MLCLYVARRLEGVRWGELGARLVLLFGSALRRENPRDVDLVVFADPGSDGEEVALRVMEAVEEAADAEADVYVVDDPGDANCFLLHEALRTGVLLYQDEVGREMLVRAVGICYDFFLSREKLGYTETLLSRVLGNAPR